MPTPPNTKEELEAAVAALVEAGGNQTKAALHLGLPRSTLQKRIDNARLAGIKIVIPEPVQYPGRVDINLPNGRILVGSDLHAWPGPAPTAHRAFVYFTDLLKPDVIIKNGDVLDMSKVSRFPPLGWRKMPEVREEIEAAQDLLRQIEEVAPPHCRRLWPCGNHDARYEVKIATVAPELIGVRGTSLVDHFPNWEPCWSVHINPGPRAIVVKHRYKGGIHATWNNVIHAGCSIITGHLHSQRVTPHTSYMGTNYGVDTGCMADPWSEQFAYLEDSPRNWIAGFADIVIKNGEMMPPSLVTVVRPGAVAYHGELYEV